MILIRKFMFSWESKGTPKSMVNSPLIRHYFFWGGWHWGGTLRFPWCLLFHVTMFYSYSLRIGCVLEWGFWQLGRWPKDTCYVTSKDLSASTNLRKSAFLTVATGFIGGNSWVLHTFRIRSWVSLAFHFPIVVHHSLQKMHARSTGSWFISVSLENMGNIQQTWTQKHHFGRLEMMRF